MVGGGGLGLGLGLGVGGRRRRISWLGRAASGCSSRARVGPIAGAAGRRGCSVGGTGRPRSASPGALGAREGPALMGPWSPGPRAQRRNPGRSSGVPGLCPRGSQPLPLGRHLLGAPPPGRALEERDEALDRVPGRLQLAQAAPGMGVVGGSLISSALQAGREMRAMQDRSWGGESRGASRCAAARCQVPRTRCRAGHGWGPRHGHTGYTGVPGMDTVAHGLGSQPLIIMNPSIP